MEVKSQDSAGERGIQKLDAEASLQEAKASIARAVLKALTRSGYPHKTFGDEAQVGRWTRGENPNLARLWLRHDVRRELVLALAEESGVADVEVVVRVRRTALSG
jgi:hypothetical protein